MRLTEHAVLLACVLTLGPRSAGQEDTRAQQGFLPGETLIYDVTWSLIPAGEVVVTLGRAPADSADLYEVVTTARSKGIASLLFPVNNEFRSHFDAGTLCSRKIFKKINEGRRHRETQITFDSERRLAILDERDPTKPDAPPRRAVIDIPACVADVVTAFYVVRRRPLEVGESLIIPINDGSKTREVTVEIQAREEIRTPLGPRPALRVEAKVFGALYRRKGRLHVWFSDDEQRLPLRIKASVAVGAITGTLKAVGSGDEAPDKSR
jgi:hypothetical protein